MLSSRTRWSLTNRLDVRRFAPRFCGAVALLGLALVAGTACSSGPQVIAFTWDKNGNQDIFTIDPKTGTMSSLTQSAQDEHSPVVSPDGKRVAYLAGTPPQMRLEIVGVDVKKNPPTTIAQGEVYIDIHWSPDGKRIVYGVRMGDALRLFVSPVDDPKPLDITPLPVRDLGGWSPDSAWVLFSATPGPDQGIYVRNPGGVNQVRLTNGPDYNPRWSPDNKNIAFISTRDGDSEVYVMKADGTGLLRITHTGGEKSDLAWSPKNDRLAFVSRGDGNAEIYTTDLKGNTVSRLTHNDVDDLSPTWSPDGNRIVFASYLHGNGDLFLMDPDGKNQTRLTSDPNNETQPSW